jgi:hypothetical protein
VPTDRREPALIDRSVRAGGVASAYLAARMPRDAAAGSAWRPRAVGDDRVSDPCRLD